MVENGLDKQDFEILKELDKSGDIDVDKLSEELDVSSSTIYYRLEKFRENDILKGEIPILDAKKLGLELTAITEIKSKYGPGYEEIGQEIADISGVQKTFFMLGEMSFIVIAHVRDHEHLQQYIDDIIHTDGIEHSATHIVLKTFKDEQRLLSNYDDEDLNALIE